MNFTRSQRWQLILGEAADDALSGVGAGGGAQGGAGDEAVDKVRETLAFLYERPVDGVAEMDDDDETEASASSGGRRGGLGPSQLTVPAWLDQIHTLFPRSAIERMERDAVETYNMTEVVTNAEALERVRPSPTLLRAILQTKQLMNPEVLSQARAIISVVVQGMLEALKATLRRTFSGSANRRTRSNLKVARNFDPKRTLIDNLRYTDPHTGKLVVRTPFFFARTSRYRVPWQIVVVVDQSGSMVDSVIHAAISAACFASLPGVELNLIAFDTQVVDLSHDVEDPVELLLRVQLGGGTLIGNAMSYAASLVRNPRRTIVVLITDFYEGDSPSTLIRVTRDLVHQGTTVLGLAALTTDAEPYYDRGLAGRLEAEGMHVGAMTPDQLVGFVSDVMDA